PTKVLEYNIIVCTGIQEEHRHWNEIIVKKDTKYSCLGCITTWNLQRLHLNNWMMIDSVSTTLLHINLLDIIKLIQMDCLFESAHIEITIMHHGQNFIYDTVVGFFANFVASMQQEHPISLVLTENKSNLQEILVFLLIFHQKWIAV
ncbi:hypothetical protein ACJX0J_038826, partial [Zea mays]